jgi:diacylglycerol kinase family enzyme
LRLLVVHNQDAGHRLLPRARLEGLLRQAGHEARMIGVDEDWAAALAAGGFEAVVAAGGDGTVAAVALAMVGREEPLALVPTGTANNIARAFTRPQPYDASVRIPSWGVDHQLALASARLDGETLPIFEAVGAGAFADYVLGAGQRSGERRDHIVSDLLNARSLIVDEVMRCDAFDASIAIDGARHDGRFVLIAALNLPTFGPRLNLAPSETPDSGLLTVCAIPEADRHAFAEWLASPARRVDDWRIGRGRSVLLATSSAIHLDGTARAAKTGARHTIEIDGGTACVRVWV